MMNNISWETYGIFIGVTMAIYYLAVLALYYRKDIIPAIEGLPKSLKSGRAQTESPVADLKQNLAASSETFAPAILDFTDELHSFLNQAPFSKLSKEEILFGMQGLISKHQGIQDSPYFPAIINLIQLECQSRCSVRLSESDMRLLESKVKLSTGLPT